MGLLFYIKRLVYRLGFRPRYGTILYSPTLEYLEYGRLLLKSLERGFADGKATREWRERQ